MAFQAWRENCFYCTPRKAPKLEGYKYTYKARHSPWEEDENQVTSGFGAREHVGWESSLRCRRKTLCFCQASVGSVLLPLAGATGGSSRAEIARSKTLELW